MKRRRLGRTDLSVSEIGFGGVEIGLEYGIQVAGQANRPAAHDAVKIVRRALDLGVNVIDTARAYGESEAIIGRALQGRREQVVVMSKLAAVKESLSGNELLEFMEDSLHTSLRLLQTDVIDLYQVHSAKAEVIRHGKIVDVLERFQRQGKIRFIGATIYTEEEASAVLDDSRIDVIQLPYNLLDPSMDRTVIPRAVEQDVAIVARSVLHRGVLTEKGAASTGPERELYEAAVAHEFLMDEQSPTLPHAATRFVLSHPQISCALLGMDRMEQVETNLTFGDAAPYSAKQIDQIRAAAPPDPWRILPVDGARPSQ